MNDAVRWFMLFGIVLMALFAVFMLLARIFSGDSIKWVEAGVFSKILTVPGLFVFLAGFGLMVYDRNKNVPLGLALAGGGWLAAMAGILLDAAIARARRARWPVVSARCVVHELQENMYAGEGCATKGWAWRVKCEFDYAGRSYRVAPKVHWDDTGHHEAPFWSEEKARRFMERRIASSGECKLHANPDNPQEAELIG